MIHWLRPLLIVALSLFVAPRVMAADGEQAVLCAADGSRLVILFDFETGAPVEQTITFETCDHCLTPPLAPGPDDARTPIRMDAHEVHARTTRVLPSPRAGIPGIARGPPQV